MDGNRGMCRNFPPVPLIEVRDDFHCPLESSLLGMKSVAVAAVLSGTFSLVWAGREDGFGVKMNSWTLSYWGLVQMSP